ALERRRLLVAALTSRAVVESCAAIVYAEKKIVAHLGSEPPNAERLEALISFCHQMGAGGRFDSLRWHLAESDEQVEMVDEYATATDAKSQPGPPDSLKAINVLPMLTELD